MEADKWASGTAIRFCYCWSMNCLLQTNQWLFLYSASVSTLATAALYDYQSIRVVLSIYYTNRKLISTLQNLSSFLGRNIVGDLSTIGGVMHHQKLQILHVVHNELVQSVGEHMLGGSVGTVTDVGHQSGTSEATSAASINTLGLSPVLLHKRLDNPPVAYQKRTFILLNLSAWKRGKEVNFFFTILTLWIGAITF